MFADVANPFGTDAFAPTALTTPTTAVYYKTTRLSARPSRRMPSAPKPLSHHIKNFLANYNG